MMTPSEEKGRWHARLWTKSGVRIAVTAYRTKERTWKVFSVAPLDKTVKTLPVSITNVVGTEYKTLDLAKAAVKRT